MLGPVCLGRAAWWQKNGMEEAVRLRNARSRAQGKRLGRRYILKHRPKAREVIQLIGRHGAGELSGSSTL